MVQKESLKSARHHWWPECVSKHWAGLDGKTGWLRPDGSCLRLPPRQLGMIGNGHLIKLGSRGEPTHWDESFESEFDRADRLFPSFIEWLKQLPMVDMDMSGEMRERFLAVPATEQEILRAVECLVSLAVRSPMNRESSVSLAERIRGDQLPRGQRETLIGLNMRRRQRLIADDIGSNAKFSVLISPSKEFVFGDGFYHNVQCARPPLHEPTILAPITPHISMLISRPWQYMKNPQLTTLVLTETEVENINLTVQVYSKNAIYFRQEVPTVHEAFVTGEHREFSDSHNPVSCLIHSVPGVPVPGRTLFGLF